MTVWGPVSDASPAPIDLEGNGNLPKWCESVASPPLTLEEPLGGAITSSFAFPRAPLTWSLGGVCEAVSKTSEGVGSGEEKCTPRHGASQSRNGEQPERGRESGRGQRGVEIYSWSWAPVRVPVILSAHALQRLTVAGQKHRGRPSRGIPCPRHVSGAGGGHKAGLNGR